MEDKEQIILEVFKKLAKPIKPGDIEKETSLDKSDISKLLKKLKDEGKIIVPKRCYYSLP